MNDDLLKESQEFTEEIGGRIGELDNHINNINNLIMDLKKHKLSIEGANLTLESLVKNEQDKMKKLKFYGIIKTNVELLTKIFSAIAEMENIKFRYNKEIDDVILNKHRILKEKLNKNNNSIEDFLEKLSGTYVNHPQAVQACKEEILDDPKYNL